ncbi:MAG: ACT domain-containing protein [Clostridiales bacterium]|nr:ACT domain-containing protein [Clostridiales bacterium]
MRAIVTVVGRDCVGIIAEVSALLSESSINILDISQTVLAEFFTMVMLVDMKACKSPFSEVADRLEKKGQSMGVSARIQREDIFEAMHRI